MLSTQPEALLAVSERGDNVDGGYLSSSPDNITVTHQVVVTAPCRLPTYHVTDMNTGGNEKEHFESDTFSKVITRDFTGFKQLFGVLASIQFIIIL